MQAQADVTDIAFQTQSLLAFRKKASKLTNTSNQATFSKTYWMCDCIKQSTNAIEIGSLTSPTRSFRHRSRSSLFLGIHDLAASQSSSDIPLSSLTLPPLDTFASEVCYNPSHSTLTCHVLRHSVLATSPTLRKRNIKKRRPQSTATPTSSWSTHYQEKALP